MKASKASSPPIDLTVIQTEPCCLVQRVGTLHQNQNHSQWRQNEFFCKKAISAREKWIFFQRRALRGNTYSSFCTHPSLIWRTEVTGLVYLLLIKIKYQRCCLLLPVNSEQDRYGYREHRFLFCFVLGLEKLLIIITAQWDLNLFWWH